jgi:hypothetical protein
MQAWTRLIPALALGLAAGAATGAEDLGAAVRNCRALADDAARLACYDEAIARSDRAPAMTKAPPKAAPAPAQTAPAAAAAPAAPAADPEDAFGRERRVQAEEQQRLDQDARALGELEATVTTIGLRADGLMTITLDNGQVWRQNRPDSRFRLKEGDRVKIQPGSLKSFILSGPTNKSTRVTRVD